MRNAWKFLNPFSRNTLNPCSEKTSWNLKTSFWEKYCPTNSKTVMKNFMVLGYPIKKSQNHGKAYA
jgi:hypothetical protein